MDKDLSLLATEQWNRNLPDLATLTTRDLITVINREDGKVAEAVCNAIAQIAEAVDVIVGALNNGGRLFYLGAGTSGLLGLLDAVELPPTFNTESETVQAIMAGGLEAMVTAQEGLEDQRDQGSSDLSRSGARSGDVVVGLTASGRTPYVLGGLAWAKAQGLTTISVSANRDAVIARESDIAIVVDTGPEVIMGSTRMKAGTAQKMVLNMLSTASMIRLGKTYKNLMVDLRPTNHKLRERAVRIVMLAADVKYSEAWTLVEQSGGEPKVAIAMALLGVSAEEARNRLCQARGVLSQLE